MDAYICMTVHACAESNWVVFVSGCCVYMYIVDCRTSSAARRQWRRRPRQSRCARRWDGRGGGE